ncbi:MAG: biotin synthase [Epsilonproteobacteria bacterium]|nr:MAG: biotin synthase [Campylobacterota bacterium]
MNKKDIYLCAINNIQSGTCSEDCKFCTQAVIHKADIKRYKLKSTSRIIKEAIAAKQNKAVGYCLVTSTAFLDEKLLRFFCQTAKQLKKIVDINLIACSGIANLSQLKQLKKAGFDSYNHNIETSENYYTNICTAHSWSKRYDTCIDIKKAGLKLCSGGIFGLGENCQDRVDMVKVLKDLHINSCAINFYHPNDALPIKRNNISVDEAFDIIKYIKDELKHTKKIMVAGGREYMFAHKQYEVFKYGANSIVIGDYLTTKGEQITKEIQTIQNLGYNIKEVCD